MPILGYKIFKVRTVVLKMYAAVCSLVGDTVESLCQIYIDKQLMSSLSQSNMAHLVSLLEGKPRNKLCVIIFY